MHDKRNFSQEFKLEQLRSLLHGIDPDLGYFEWIKVLMVIFYETSGSDEGLALADEWSSHGKKYRGLRDVKYRWDHFDISYKKPVRMPTLIRMAKR